MWKMIAIPANQSRIAGVFKKPFQLRRFNVAVAKDNVPFSLVA
jgi:hypothetical protein